MSKFPITVVPSYGITKKSQPKIRIANFGSGYSQRSTFGINQNLKVYQLSFNNISFSDANTIETFLDSMAGVTSFSYPVPDSGTIITGTYSQTNANISITIADYNLSDNDEVYVNFLTGNAASGFYAVTETQSDHFKVQGVSQTTSGNVAVTKPEKFICRDWNRTVGVANRATINATFEEVAEA
ncbi:phage tail protein [Hyphomonas sp.]|uniref:phage tail protein n=1 Tax=Hyphomonas sp. TaxID=87 RepID=UPI000C8A38D4|nr:phage tail protein [Hyphomonas sp.]MAL46934.1 hypothetical protein [Hyphomonas sp.]